MQIPARILRTMSYGPTGLSTMVESIVKSVFVCLSILQPNLLKSSPHTETSKRCGTDFRVVFPGARMVAAIIGSAAFFEPFTRTEPDNFTGPSMRNISIINFP